MQFKPTLIQIDIFTFTQGQDVINIPVMLVGNKCDESAELREVSQPEGQVRHESRQLKHVY